MPFTKKQQKRQRKQSKQQRRKQKGGAWSFLGFTLTTDADYNDKVTQLEETTKKLDVAQATVTKLRADDESDKEKIAQAVEARDSLQADISAKTAELVTLVNSAKETSNVSNFNMDYLNASVRSEATDIETAILGGNVDTTTLYSTSIDVSGEIPSITLNGTEINKDNQFMGFITRGKICFYLPKLNLSEDNVLIVGSKRILIKPPENSY